MKLRSMRYVVMVLLTAVSIVCFAEGVAPRRVILDRVVAVVGSSSVLLSEVLSYANRIEAQQRSQGYTSQRDPKAEALETLMTQKMLSTRAIIDSVDVNLGSVSYQVEDQISAMRDAAGGIIELEREQNMEIFNIRDMLRRNMEEQMQAQAMQSHVLGNVTIIPGEVEKFYKNSNRDELPMIGEQYRYAQITRFPSSIGEAKRRVRERLLEMRERVITGQMKFSVLAQMYSVDPGSSYRGGEMEPQPLTAFVAEFSDALENLKPGQVSEVVETEFGYHIIELIDVKGSLYHCRHILLRPTYSTPELIEPLNFLDSLVDAIRDDYITFERAALEHSDDASSKMNGGVVSNHDLLERYNASDAKLTVTKFLKEDFGARGYKSLDDFNALSKLKVGEISPAFTTEDLVGNQVSKIVKLVEIYPAHEASLDEDYLHLESLALQDKQKLVFDKWLEECIASTYVYIDPEFRDLEFESSGWVK